MDNAQVIEALRDAVALLEDDKRDLLRQIADLEEQLYAAKQEALDNHNWKLDHMAGSHGRVR